MQLYKLTDRNNATRNNTRWGNNVAHWKWSKRAPALCSDTVIHAYVDRNLALLLNPIHSNIGNPKLWLAEGVPVISDWGKVGCYMLKTVEELPLPDWYVDIPTRLTVLVRFADKCAATATATADWAAADWAARYATADWAAAEAAARYAAYAARYAARYAAAYAAEAAAYAAEADHKPIDFVALANEAVKEILDNKTKT